MTSTARRADATSPALSLSLRVALLESLVVGRSQLGNGVSAASDANISSTSRSILSRTLQAQEKLDEALKPHRPVSQFAADYSHNRPYLIPSFATLGGGTSLTSSQDAGKGEGEEQALPGGTTMTPQTQVALLLEAEQDLRDLERDLRQCQTLDERGVAGAGKLADHEALTPKVEELKASASKKSKDDNALEEQVMSLVEDYSRYVESISQLFIHWDHALNDLELQVGAMERSRA